MSFAKKSLAAAATSIAALALAAGAIAQTPPPGPGPGGPGRDPQFMQHMKERMEARQAERAKALHDVLRIRADQEGAFQAFTASMHPQHDGKGPRGDRFGGPPAPGAAPESTPARLDKIVARMHEREQRMEARITAIKSFYAALSPEQQQTFDSLPVLRGGEGFGGRGGGHGRGGPGGPPGGPDGPRA